jgi:hypothetical protein
MKQLRMMMICLSVSVLAVACGVSEDVTTPASGAEIGAPADEAGAAAADQQSGDENFTCAPGPSSQWCQNVQGKACPTPGTTRRCYIPNYCEWMMCICEGGVWGSCS